jgi:hypothetical protein
MHRTPTNTSNRSIRTLFVAGSLCGLTDRHLLDRFLAREGDGDEADAGAEAAFQVLVKRHGPMVLRLCRSLLNDRHDADDAFQATFLVLARRASSIRDGQAVVSWLYSVATRVAARARGEAGRRRLVERIVAEQARRGQSIREPKGALSRCPSFTKNSLGCPNIFGHRLSCATSRAGVMRRRRGSLIVRCGRWKHGSSGAR